jgi:hypothetical protein
MNRGNQLDSSFSNRLGRFNFLGRTNFIDYNDVWTLILDSLSHNDML